MGGVLITARKGEGGGVDFFKKNSAFIRDLRVSIFYFSLVLDIFLILDRCMMFFQASFATVSLLFPFIFHFLDYQIARYYNSEDSL